MKRLMGLSLLLLPAAASADFTVRSAGTSGAEFLKLSPDAHSAALGDAHAAFAMGPNALHWNPAGLAGLSRTEASTTFASPLGRAEYQRIAVAVPVGDTSGFGVDLIRLSPGTVETTDAQGRPQGTVRPEDLSLAAGYGAIWKGVHLGASVRWVSSRLLERASTFAIDAGAQIPAHRRVSVGLGVRRLGPGLRFENERSPLPTTLYAGAGIAAYPGWDVVVEATFPRDNTAPVLHAGVEALLHSRDRITMMGRMGYNTRTFTTHGFAGPALGIGLAWRDWSFDYALAPGGEVGLSHLLTLGISGRRK